jgi:hypothetical protein
LDSPTNCAIRSRPFASKNACARSTSSSLIPRYLEDVRLPRRHV